MILDTLSLDTIRLDFGMICVIGAVAVDLIACKERFRAGTSNPADVRMSLGGVGYRIFRQLRTEKRLITAVGCDPLGDWVERQLAGQAGVVVYRIDRFASACYLALMESGSLRCAAADMKIMDQGLGLSQVQAALPPLGSRDTLVLEANLAPDLVKSLLEDYAHRTRCVFEAVSVEKLARHGDNLRGLTLLSLNEEEFSVLISRAGGRATPEWAAAERAAAEFMEQREIQALLVGRGEAGLHLFLPGRRLEFKSGRTFKVPDTTGAGDRLLGTFLSRLDRGVPVEEAVAQAMRAVEEALGHDTG